MAARYIALSSLFLVFLLPAVPGPALADSAASASAPAAQASPSTQVDPAFLLLPAYDVQWVNPPKSVRVGDTLTVRIAPEGQAVSLPKELQVKIPPGTENADDLPFSWSDGITAAPDGSLQLSVTPLKPGQLTLPSLALADGSGRFVARTIPASLEVSSSIASNDPKPKNPDPPRPPVSLGIPTATLILLVLLTLALVAAVVFLLVRWSRSRRGELPAKPVEPPKPEDEVALALLAQLERKSLLKAGQFKAHYFAVSEILKHYLGARYDFDAAESTTYEMLMHLQDAAEGRSQKAAPRGAPNVVVIDTLREMFDKLDRVKFTDHVPESAEGMQLLGEARKLVMTTRRPPSVASLGAGNNAAS